MTPLRLLPALPLLVLMLATGCDDEPELGPPDHTYEGIRGRIEAMPGDKPGGEMHIKHEAIDDFVDRQGETSGMNAMTMPFVPADDLDVSDLSAGDKARFTFEVRWEAQPMLRITDIEKLPADTELEFRKAQPPGGAPDAEEEGDEATEDEAEGGEATEDEAEGDEAADPHAGH